jgi:methylmalonyl-CoA mutase
LIVSILKSQKTLYMDQNKKTGLFTDFPPVSTKEWEEKILEDLKGADYEKKLVWSTVEGLKIRPYYRAEDLENLTHVKALPAQYPFVRGKKVKDNNWIIRQDFEEKNPSEANSRALNAIKKGTDSVGFNTREIHDEVQLKLLLEGIDVSKIPVNFIHSKNYLALYRNFASLLEKSAQKVVDAKGSLNFDPLGYFLLYGKFYKSVDNNYNEAIELLSASLEATPEFRIINVNGQHFHNAGANIVQELAFSLAQGNEYLAALTEKSVSVDDLAPRIQFTVAVGSNYFLEIAKLRAVKMLWAKIVEQYKPQSEESMKMNIHAVTSGWNKSIYDPHVNMLRTTTEAMAAAIAGVDSMTVEPFDTTYKKSDEFSSRIARNQQIVLKNEAWFSKVADAAAGSYYIENITDAIADATWKLFVQMEEAGGFVKAVESGFIKEEIEKTCQKRDMDIAMRKQVFVGVNQYPNLQERMLNKMEPTAKLSDLGGLRPYRGMQAFEALRMSVENHETKGFSIPKVYLFTYGNLAMRKARATFSTNFFGCAGYQIQEAPAIKNLEDGVEKALASKAEIIVFCSSDEEYTEMIPAAKAIKEKAPETQVVVAGNPKEIMNQLSEAGVGHYIHMRTNALESLQRFNDLLGIA